VTRRTHAAQDAPAHADRANRAAEFLHRIYPTGVGYYERGSAAAARAVPGPGKGRDGTTEPARGERK
jgi:hypothetical protein